MSLGAKILKNTGLQLIGRVLSTILGVIAVVVITRHLGAYGYGGYTTATSFLQFFAIIADFGLTLTAITMLSEQNSQESSSSNTQESNKSINRENVILANLTGLRVTTALIFFGLAPIIVLFFPYSGEIKTGVLIGALAYAVLAWNQMLTGVFQRHLAMRYAVLAEVGGRATLLGAMIIATLLHGGVVSMIWAMVAANLIQLGIMLLGARNFVRLGLAFDFKIWREIFHRAWPIGLTTVLNLVYLKGDIIVLSLYRSQEEVGIYGAAYKVLDVLTAVPMMFMGLVLPPLTRAWKAGDLETVRRYVQKSFDAMTLIGLPMLAGGVILSKPLMLIIGGPEFGGGAGLLAILLVALFMVFMSAVFSFTVVAMDIQKRVIFAYALAAIVGITAYFLYIPRFGGVAAAWITVITEALIAFSTFLVVARQIHFMPNLNNASRICFATLLMSLGLIAFHNLPDLGLIPLGATFYGVAVWALKIVPKEYLSLTKV